MCAAFCEGRAPHSTSPSGNIASMYAPGMTLRFPRPTSFATPHHFALAPGGLIRPPDPASHSRPRLHPL